VFVLFGLRQVRQLRHIHSRISDDGLMLTETDVENHLPKLNVQMGKAGWKRIPVTVKMSTTTGKREARLPYAVHTPALK